jgi:hypothetical protein
MAQRAMRKIHNQLENIVADSGMFAAGDTRNPL